jgi:branched-chain amino acid transport system permease protein
MIASAFTRYRAEALMLLAVATLPAIDLLMPREMQFAVQFIPIFIFAILALGLNVISGLCGLLNLGIAGFMAIGVYTFGILTSEVYPFQIGFLPGVVTAMFTAGFAGLLIGVPTLRLRGDYLAIVTLAFGEIVQDLLRNLEVITKGSQGINPLPRPIIFGVTLNADHPLLWYYLLLGIVVLAVVVCHNVERSPFGRAMLAIREDELAARCMGVTAVRVKLFAFVTGAVLAGLAGALWASYLDSTGEPGNYDFQLSILALCIIIIGGLGSTRGVLVGAALMVGFNSIALAKISTLLSTLGLASTSSIYASPNNWKYFIFGIALIVMMRVRPQGLLPTKLYRSDAGGDQA